MKNALCVLLVIGLLAATCGCAGGAGQPAATTTSFATTASTQTATTFATEQSGTDTPVTDSPNNLPSSTLPSEGSDEGSFTEVFDCFSLTFPANWRGAYTTMKTTRGIAFYEKENYLHTSHGKLFSILFVEEADYRDGMYPDYHDLGVYNGRHAIWLNVTDVQYTSEYAEPYMALYNQLDIVRDGFVYCG